MREREEKKLNISHYSRMITENHNSHHGESHENLVKMPHEMGGDMGHMSGGLWSSYSKIKKRLDFIKTINVVQCICCIL